MSNKIEQIINSIMTCDGCKKQFTFYERQFPREFRECKICKRDLCCNCWGHKHLLAWKFCAHCCPSLDCDQSKISKKRALKKGNEK